MERENAVSFEEMEETFEGIGIVHLLFGADDPVLHYTCTQSVTSAINEKNFNIALEAAVRGGENLRIVGKQRRTKKQRR